VRIWTPSNTWFLWSTRVHIPNDTCIGSTVLHSSRRSVLMFYKEPPLPLPQNCPFAWGIWVPYNAWFRLSQLPERHRFIHFCRAHSRDRPTDNAMYPSVATGRIWLALRYGGLIIHDTHQEMRYELELLGRHLQPLLRSAPRKLPNSVKQRKMRAIMPFKFIQCHRF